MVDDVVQQITVAGRIEDGDQYCSRICARAQQRPCARRFPFHLRLKEIIERRPWLLVASRWPWPPGAEPVRGR
jgi:hypothetical protein